MRSFGQSLMLIEIMLILCPISLISLASSPLVFMVSLSQPVRIEHLLLGISFLGCLGALTVAWSICIRYWRDGSFSLSELSKRQFIMALFGIAICLLSIILAVFHQFTGFVLGSALLIPCVHLVLVSAKAKKN